MCEGLFWSLECTDRMLEGGAAIEEMSKRNRQWSWQEVEPELQQLEGPGKHTPLQAAGEESHAGAGSGCCACAPGPPGPVTLSRERTGKTPSLGESSPVLVTPHLLIVIKSMASGLYISHISLANVSLPWKLICALVLAQ